MSAIKEFITAAKDAEADEEGFGFDLEFGVTDERLDEKDPNHRRVMVAHKPSGGQITLFMAVAGDDLRANTEVISFAINFLYSILEPEDRRYLRKRLFDMDDPFGEKEVAEILEYVIEEWTGKAGGSRTVSPRSQRPNGKSSTARRSRTA